MKLKIKVHVNSSRDEIKKINDKEYEVWIKEKPVDGKANKVLEKLLKQYFKKEVKVIRGMKSKNKIGEVVE